MNRRGLAALGISLAVTIAAFFTAEVAVRVADLQPTAWPAADVMSYTKAVVVDPVLGPGLRPGWSGRWLGGYQVSVDEHGFRATGLPAAAAPQAGVAFLGDSCTFGWGVDTPDTFVARLDARQREAGAVPFDLMNAAYPGYSAIVGMHVLRERVLPLHPDLVVIGFSANNAFRFSLVSDAERFRFVRVRKLVLRSRLLHIAAAWLANRTAPKIHPRKRELVFQTPVRELKRVAAIDQFEAAIRTMVADARSAGAKALFLIIPRASGVSNQFGFEDAGNLARRLPPDGHPSGAAASADEINLLEASCLDLRALEDPIRVLHERAGQWRPVYPKSSALRAALQQGAHAYVENRYADATERFAGAHAMKPRAPLALYDLGVAKLSNGDQDAGLQDLAEADRLACNVFLQHQILLWRVATELGVPVVDLTPHFQAHDGEDLFLDPAHPNRTGHQIVADALWPVVSTLAKRED